ncbi:FAD-dependent oxidoreductase [Halovulum sp. GXIMD14794]
MRIAVIGRGLIGSAAARHLALAGHDTILIGPSEPENKTAHQGVFGSHYDEGRITRSLATDPYWAEVSAASIARYHEIEAQGGIRFFTQCGALMAGPETSAFIAETEATLRRTETRAQRLDRAAMARAFPALAFPEGFAGFHEAEGAGHISPRKLVAAQTIAARKLGARIVDAPAEGVEETGAGITVQAGDERIAADRVLVAAGGMTDHLLPEPLGLKVLARTVVFFELDEVEAKRLSHLPSLVLRMDDAAEPYMLPPIRYPDGRVLLKLGGDPVDVPLTSPQEIGDWFRSGGNAEVRDYLVGLMARLIPDLSPTAIHMEPCMTTYSADGYPVIRRLTGRLAVATAGNGAGAKCSDELGRRGALAALNEDLNIGEPA